MDSDPHLTDRLEHAVTLLERTLAWLEQHQPAVDIDRISATVDPSLHEQELAEKLAAAERQLIELKAASAPNSQRRTVPASTADMLTKRGIGDGPVDVVALDAALAGLSLEQRIAVKSQLLRAGALA